MPPEGLPAPFLHALEGREELLVTSRDGPRLGTVRAWFVLRDAVYLFADAYSVRARRWRTDPWVRLTVPGAGATIEARVQFVEPAEVDDALAELVVDRWGMWGAATPQGLRRMLRDGSHVLLRVAGR